MVRGIDWERDVWEFSGKVEMSYIMREVYITKMDSFVKCIAKVYAFHCI